eukprot:c21661_g2_i1 orf=589-855(+)
MYWLIFQALMTPNRGQKNPLDRDGPECSNSINCSFHTQIMNLVQLPQMFLLPPVPEHHHLPPSQQSHALHIAGQSSSDWSDCRAQADL